MKSIKMTMSSLTGRGDMTDPIQASSTWSRIWRWLGDLETTLDLTDVDFLSARLQRLELRIAALEAAHTPLGSPADVKAGSEPA